ncbi:hypothetical protein BGZ83_009429 [Gryganskiella cystojenkinii]|nr:hypothetical protein BGZ83_009429 [Gryganskiella cystojenkinii]
MQRKISAALFSKLREKFDPTKIPDATLISTFLHRENAANLHFDTVDDKGETLEAKAIEIIKKVGHKVFVAKLPLYPSDDNPIKHIPPDDIKTMDAHLSYNIQDYLRRAKDL